MKRWILSRYTSTITCDSGEVLLYNSFLGSIARVSEQQFEEIKEILLSGFNESELNQNIVLQELYRNGFFVPSEIDEHTKVIHLLDNERETTRLSLLILPHENCNFRCIYCYEKFERGKMKSDIINGLKLYVNQKLQEPNDFKELNISWFGGEPLLALDVIYELSTAFIKICQANGIAYGISGMSTNGYLLTSQVFEALLECNIRVFQITLDGPEALHNSNRKLVNGGITYLRIIENLKNIHNRNDDFLIRIRVNFNDDSVGSIINWLDTEINPLFAGDSRFALSFNSIGKWGGPNDAGLNVCDPLSAAKHRSQFIRTTHKCNYSERMLKDQLMPHGNVCYASKDSSMVVGSDGSIYKYTVAFDDPRNSVGRLTSDGQLLINKELWNQWTKLDDIDTSWCLVCSFYPACQGRKCPLSNMNNKKPVCPMNKSEYENLIKSVADAT